ncbi:hypothetical protein D3C71_1650960 [compost metagenome]
MHIQRVVIRYAFGVTHFGVDVQLDALAIPRIINPCLSKGVHVLPGRHAIASIIKNGGDKVINTGLMHSAYCFHCNQPIDHRAHAGIVLCLVVIQQVNHKR